MADRRTRINATLKQAALDGHRLVAIDSRHDLEVLNHQMALKAGQAADYRQQIRHLLFEAGRRTKW